MDSVRQGLSLAEIDTDAFLKAVNATSAIDGGNIVDAVLRSELQALFDEITLGPVVEVIRLTDANESISLERTWFSMTPNSTPAETLLAVRRTLFRRRVFHVFRSITGIDEILTQRISAIKRVILGSTLDEVELLDAVFPPTAQLVEHGRTSHKAARDAILGAEATDEQLDAWLNDPSYGFDIRCKLPSSDRSTPTDFDR